MAARIVLGHNRAMNLRLLPASLVLLGLLSACQAPVPGHSAAPVLPPGSGKAGRIEWQGRLACADCRGIDTRLQLQRDGDNRDYLLTEVFMANDGAARFVERGQWRQQRDLLRLHGADGGRRVYALLQDGRLQQRDWHGRPLSDRDDDYLQPVNASNPQ